MKGKNLLWMLLILIAGMSMMGVDSSPLATVSVSPASIIGPPPTINETFTINITVSNVNNLWGWQAGMTFNPSVLECLSFQEGPFLKQGGSTIWQPGTINNTSGIITFYGCTLISNSTPVSGNGTLATLSFRVKDYGSSTLHLGPDPVEENVILIDSTYTPIPIALKDGYFELPGMLEHDVAIVNVTVSIPWGATAIYPNYPGWSVNIIVVAKNNGNYTESFNVTAYYNLTAIETKTVTDLAPSNETTLWFTWNAVSVGTYTISAEASVVPGETRIDDNVLIDGTVEVWKPGDADGSGFVDIGDFGILGASWFKGHGDLGYLWQADFDGSGFVDIGDFGILGAYWFK